MIIDDKIGEIKNNTIVYLRYNKEEIQKLPLKTLLPDFMEEIIIKKMTSAYGRT
ncbi:MAG: hypothetical protein ACFNKL_00390 [Treponema sp.]